MESHKIEVLKQQPKRMSPGGVHQFYVDELKRASKAVDDTIAKLAEMETRPVLGQDIFKTAELRNTIYVGQLYLKSLEKKVHDTVIRE